MTEQKLTKPDYVFEVSWEVCNKVGGIYTVITTKAPEMLREWGDNFITIGPDVWKGTGKHPEFEEDPDLFLSWREQALAQGLKIKVGRWKAAGNSIAILVDFTPFFFKKDEILTHFWNKFHLDSLTGQWDYIEPAMFGFAAAKVIESFYRFHLSYKDKIVAQFHEWMTGTGILHLHENIPQIGTVFTTHATAVGRSIAGNGLPLYGNLAAYDGNFKAREFHITAKQSLEKNSAKYADCFTTVSEITAKECTQFLEKKPDLVTPNGFDSGIVPGKSEYDEARAAARKKLLEVASALCGEKLPEDALLVAKSGRYEYRNKGIDLFIDAIGKLRTNPDVKRTIVAFIMVPAHHTGAREELVKRLADKGLRSSYGPEILTHHLQGIENDPIMNGLKRNQLFNNNDDKVKVVFAPTYLDGADGIFNLHYYNLIIGFDFSVFPSYYEPWGYTPLESIAFHVPTVTTLVTGFGVWVKSNFGDSNPGIHLLERTDDNDAVVADEIANLILKFEKKSKAQVKLARASAYRISEEVLWNHLVLYYKNAYHIALQKAGGRESLYREKHEVEPLESVRELAHPKNNRPKWRRIFVQSELPAALAPLKELSQNLWSFWNYQAQELFEMMDAGLWKKYKKNPVALLDVLPYAKLKRLEKNQPFLQKLKSVYKEFQEYINQPKEAGKPKIGYFCMEYGLHPVIKLYSGGLGILAGDYLKEASDSNVDMVGVGLLYRYGYFKQALSLHGDQLVQYKSQKFSFLPVLPVRDENENWIKIDIALPGRKLCAKVWRINVGRVPLYLLDTDIAENSAEDRAITHQLYGGDQEHRLKQEILLGIGGVRLLEKLKIQPDLFHCNEGHAAFLGLERIRMLMQDAKISFYEALEIVRAGSLFTTHTPVPAGHDVFSEELIRTYLSNFADIFNIKWEQFTGLGRVDATDVHEKFSMSYLAARLSQEINGVSQIHGEVSREMFNVLWPGFMANELHVGYVTNGVHFPTWTSKSWQNFYRKNAENAFTDVSGNTSELWKKLPKTPAEGIWEIRKELKSELIKTVGEKVQADLTQRHDNPKNVVSILNALQDDTLIIGFARRFATYKRAYLLFHDLHKLSNLVNRKDQPVQFLYSGKAHPKDKAGQDLIKRITSISEMPEFQGKIIFLENYDIELAKCLVQGVDVWLNHPERPFEASGTSGMKAVMNGVLNLSVLDGWWAEGYVPGAGWELPREKTYDNKDFQDELDAEVLYRILDKEVIPQYFDRNQKGVPEKWVEMIKKCISEIAPQFTTRTMITNYQRKYYTRLFERSNGMKADNFKMAKDLFRWKSKVAANWDEVHIMDMVLHDSAQKPLPLGEDFYAKIVLGFRELSVEDIGIEVLFIQKKDAEGPKEIIFKEELKVINSNPGKATYECKFPVVQSGVYEYGFRIFPKNKMLPNQMDFNLVKWI